MWLLLSSLLLHSVLCVSDIIDQKYSQISLKQLPGGPVLGLHGKLFRSSLGSFQELHCQTFLQYSAHII